MRYRIQYWRWLTLAAKGRGLADRGLRLARGLRDRAVAKRLSPETAKRLKDGWKPGAPR